MFLPSFATHMASQSTSNMNIRQSHGSASWMNQSGVPMPGPSGMNYGIGNGVSMQTGMASVTGNNGMFSGMSSMPSGNGLPIYNHNTMMSNSGGGSMMSNGAGMMPTVTTSGGTTTLAPPGLFTSGLTGANLPPFEAFIEQMNPFGLFVLENYLKCKGNFWFQEPGLAARWNALTRREQEENACYFWNQVQERSKAVWNTLSQEENLRIYGLSASIKAVATQAHLLNKRMVGVLENDRLTFSLQSIPNNPNNTVLLYENVPQQQPTPTRSAFTASAYTESVSSADEAQNTPTSNRTRFKEVKSVETMTDNVLQVCNTCGNAMGVEAIHSRGEVELIDLADATQPPVTTGVRPGNPVARHLNEAQQHENVPLVNPPHGVPEENESGINAGLRDDRNNEPNHPNRMPILDEMKMTDRAAEIEVQQILAQGNNAQQNRAVGGGKAVKRTACPRKVRKDRAGPSKKGGSPKGFKTAYTMFVTTEGPRIREELRNRPEMEDNHYFNRYVGQLWRAMSEDEREPYNKMSLDEYERIKQQAKEGETAPTTKERPENEPAQEMSAEDNRFRAYQTSAKVGSLRASTIANNMGPPRPY